MNFNDIETMVKSKFKDIKKHAEEIAHEIEVRSGYLRKAEQYKRLEFNLSFALDDIESTAKDVQTAKTSANKDSVTVKGKAPNTLYIEKRNLMKQKLEMLGEDMGGYKGIKADGGKVDQAKQLAAKTAKDIEGCQKQTQQLAEYIEGSDWEGQFANKVKDVLLIMAKFQEELVQPIADHQKAIDNLSQNLAKYDTLSIKQGLDRVNP